MGIVVKALIETYKFDYEHEFDYKYDFLKTFRFDYKYEFDCECDFSETFSRVRTGPGNPGKPWKIFEALEIPGNPWKSPGIFLLSPGKSQGTLLKK